MTLKGFAKFAAAALLTATLAVPAYAELKVSGDIDFDASVTSTDNGTDKTTVYNSGVAGTVRLKDKKESGDNFVAAEIELEFDNQDGSDFDVEELYMQVGNKEMNLKVGRFEKLDTFAIGQDEVVADDGQFTADGSAYGRANEGATDMAFQYTAVEGVTVELGAIFGKAGLKDATGDTISDSYGNVTAFRPAVSAKIADVITINAAYDSYTESAQDSDNKDEVNKSGFSAQAIFAQDNIEAALSYASETSDSKNAAGTKISDLEKTSYSVYATVAEAGPGSLGLSYTGWSNKDKNNDDAKTEGSLWFASYLMPIMGVEGTTLGLGYSASVNKVDGSKDDKQSKTGITLDYRF